MARVLGDPAIRRSLVLGPGDAGKSTFCRLLLARAAEAARPMALLDADPAQKLVGPPACVTLGRGGGLAGLAFLGTLNPLAGWARLVEGMRRLAATAGPVPLLVNTSGLLAGAGRRLKAAKIAAVRPDLLLALGEDQALSSVLRDHPGIATLRLPRASQARRKGEGERRALRRAAFRAYFAEAPAWVLPLDGLRMEDAPAPGEAARRLVALVGGDGRDLALGIVLGEAGQGRLSLRGPQPDARVDGLRWGALRLEEDFADRPVAPLRSPRP